MTIAPFIFITYQYPNYRLSCVQKFSITKEQMLQVWGILKSLHAVGIVHRDVRAENIMQDESG